MRWRQGSFAPNENWYRGNQWPPSNTEPPDTPTAANPQLGVPLPWPQLGATMFPRRAWGSSHYALVVLGQFVAVNNGAWDNIALPAVPNPAGVALELRQLEQLVEYRPGVLAEALAQRQDISVCWRGIVLFGKASHPYTYDLVQAALRVAQLAAMHYKHVVNRPRPSQLSPALLPPIEVPGHASFPSAHATEAYMVAAVLNGWRCLHAHGRARRAQPRGSRPALPFG